MPGQAAGRFHGCREGGAADAPSACVRRPRRGGRSPGPASRPQRTSPGSRRSSRPTRRRGGCRPRGCPAGRSRGTHRAARRHTERERHLIDRAVLDRGHHVPHIGARGVDVGLHMQARSLSSARRSVPALVYAIDRPPWFSSSCTCGFSDSVFANAPARTTSVYEPSQSHISYGCSVTEAYPSIVETEAASLGTDLQLHGVRAAQRCPDAFARSLLSLMICLPAGSMRRRGRRRGGLAPHGTGPLSSSSRTSLTVLNWFAGPQRGPCTGSAGPCGPARHG
jgi:hypothetical protein